LRSLSPVSWLPSLSDVLFGALVVWLFVAGSGWEGLLTDGDTGWHIRVGDYILETRSAPTRDLFSFSKEGEPWYAWEWLADVAFALAHRRWGLAGVAVFSGLLISATAIILFRQMLWRGASALAALAVVLLATGAGSMHHLARPHLFTLLLLAISLWVLERDRRTPDAVVWILVPLTALWVNLHGGFLALLAGIVLLAAGSTAEALAGGPGWAEARRYTLLTVCCGAATLVNPYGFRLHLHIARYLHSDWIRNRVEEFQSPQFRSENLLHFELLLVAGLLVAGWLLSKKRLADALPVVFWAHCSLVSVRHAPVFAVACAPLLAAELSGVWERWAGSLAPRSIPAVVAATSRDLTAGFRRATAWTWLFAGLAIALTPSSKWPRDFPVSKFPVALAGRPELSSGARVFTSDEWGDYLIYRAWPRQRVFIDGRSDFYGQGIGEPYLELMRGGQGWEKLLSLHGFRLALLPADWPLASLLERAPGWRIVTRDGRAVLFERTKDLEANGTE